MSSNKQIREVLSHGEATQRRERAREVEELCVEMQKLTDRVMRLASTQDREVLEFDSEKPWRTDPRRGEPIIERQIERVMRMRRIRSQYLPRKFLGEPAWDILLDLMLAYVRNHSVYTGILMRSVGLTDEQLMATLAQLEAEGLVAGRLDPGDPRHVMVWLTEPGARRMRHIIDYL